MKTIKNLHNNKKLDNIKISFIDIYEKLQKQKKESNSEKSLQLIFLIETETVNLYFKTIKHHIEILSLKETEFDGLNGEERKKEVYEIAVSELMEILNKYENQDLTRLLESLSLDMN